MLSNRRNSLATRRNNVTDVVKAGAAFARRKYHLYLPIPVPLLAGVAVQDADEENIRNSILRHALLVEFSRVLAILPPGVAVVPYAAIPNRWHCFLIVRQGWYRGATIPFTLEFPHEYPQTPPSVIFLSPFPPHPLIDPVSGTLVLDQVRQTWDASSMSSVDILIYVKSLFYNKAFFAPDLSLSIANPSIHALFNEDPIGFLRHLDDYIETRHTEDTNAIAKGELLSCFTEEPPPIPPADSETPRSGTVPQSAGPVLEEPQSAEKAEPMTARKLEAQTSQNSTVSEGPEGSKKTILEGISSVLPPDLMNYWGGRSGSQKLLKKRDKYDVQIRAIPLSEIHKDPVPPPQDDQLDFLIAAASTFSKDVVTNLNPTETFFSWFLEEYVSLFEDGLGSEGSPERGE